MNEAIIRVDLDKKCKQCKKSGATESGICLECINKNLKSGKYDSILAKYRKKKGGDAKCQRKMTLWVI